MRIKWAKIAALGVTASGTAALLLTATGATGAYFSDTHSGAFTGKTGAITLSTSNMNLYFSDMLPGVSQSQKVDYANTSVNAEDVYLVFPNSSALGALNNLGTYGDVTVASGSAGTVFSSSNLNDNLTSCLSFSPAGCNPLPAVIKLQSSLPSGGTGSMTFSFNYASKLTDGTNGMFENASFNPYPVVGEVWTDVATSLATDCPSAYGVNPATVSGHGVLVGSVGGGQCTGLPYQIVATQVGATAPTP